MITSKFQNKYNIDKKNIIHGITKLMYYINELKNHPEYYSKIEHHLSKEKNRNFINAQSSAGWTALFCAVNHYPTNKYCQSNLIKLLIDSGSDVKITNSYDWNVIMLLSHEKYYYDEEFIKIFQLLLKSGCDLYNIDNKGNDILSHYLLNYNLINIYFIKILLDQGYDPNKLDKYGNNLLMRIFLFEYKNNVVIMDLNKNVHLLKSNLKILVQLIIDYGCDIDHKNNNGDTCLTISADNELDKEIIKTLLIEKADYRIKNKLGKTFFDLVNPDYIIDFIDIINKNTHYELCKKAVVKNITNHQAQMLMRPGGFRTVLVAMSWNINNIKYEDLDDYIIDLLGITSQNDLQERISSSIKYMD
ncbi:ankyrin repeat protein [Cotonvirus japonicus]|uniref:Ankyrin repeat protein n=1 Tax=Cotonvirus japonicus TaxID=2811091 RepID=A0ABM7NTN4_9VIRU|nr:ankyrin repeat protein [Cotonvirus japonicus]BCS83489.1 ankyrin repeat protein [Cotonvirus japonicus]